MRFFTSLLAPLTLAVSSLSHPLEERDGVQTVHLVFHGGPASYELVIPADNQIYSTNNDISIDIIDAPDYFADTHCTFYTNGDKALKSTITPQGLQQIMVGPPQPVTGVSCFGECLGIYGTCFENGMYVAPCCNGFCAANRCRPWVRPT